MIFFFTGGVESQTANVTEEESEGNRTLTTHNSKTKLMIIGNSSENISSKLSLLTTAQTGTRKFQAFLLSVTKLAS